MKTKMKTEVNYWFVASALLAVMACYYAYDVHTITPEIVESLMAKYNVGVYEMMNVGASLALAFSVLVFCSIVCAAMGLKAKKAAV